jgi:hypothetical protein
MRPWLGDQLKMSVGDINLATNATNGTDVARDLHRILPRNRCWGCWGLTGSSTQRPTASGRL